MSQNAFDIIAKTKTKETKTTKIAAEVTNNMKELVDIIISKKATIKQLDAEKKEYEDTIIGHVRKQQDAHAYNGNYSKSFSVPGIKGILTYTTCDSFSIPEDIENLEELRKLLGTKFDIFFKKKRTITLKETVQNNDVLINKIIKAVTAAGLQLDEAFEVTDKLEAVDNLDEMQYQLPASKMEKFRILVKQKKACLK
jgi:hypothetical protein